jgi:hypothetical protein
MMLGELIASHYEADRLQREGRLADALDRYRDILDHLRVLPGLDSAVLSLRAQSARNAVALLIKQQGYLDEIYALLSEERTALTGLIDIPVGPAKLHRHLSGFMRALEVDDEHATKQAFALILTALFGRVSPMDVLETHLALIRNTLMNAEVIFNREGDLDDARGLTEMALSEILALLPQTTISVASHPAIPLLTDALDLLARLDGHEVGWFERAKIICTLLPTAPTPWAMSLIQPVDIAALILGLGEPEAA